MPHARLPACTPPRQKKPWRAPLPCDAEGRPVERGYGDGLADKELGAECEEQLVQEVEEQGLQVVALCLIGPVQRAGV